MGTIWAQQLFFIYKFSQPKQIKIFLILEN
nr:MAG TPA: hypothetical protein [Caudoviricetes sp.]